MKDCMVIGLKSKGFSLDFEAKSDIESGFECTILSDGNHIVIISGKNIFSETKGNKTKMIYTHYYCRLGDDQYLTKFLESEVFARHSILLTGEYGGLFIKLIDRVMSYGTKNVELLVRPLKNNHLLDKRKKINQFQKGENVVDLCEYRSSRLLTPPKIRHRMR